MQIKKVFDYFLHSYKHFALFLILAAVVLAIPFTFGVYSQRYGDADIELSEEITEPVSNSSSDVQIASAGGCDVLPADFANDGDEQQIITLINQYRQQNNLPALTPSAALTKGAQWMADDMATHNNTNSHTDSLGRDYAGRASACGYSNYQTAVDILLAGTATPPLLAFTTWKNSPTHNPVMLNSVTGVTRTWQAIGVGKSDKGTAPFTRRYVVMFGETNDGGTVPTVAPTVAPTAVPTQPIPTTPPITITQPITTPGVTVTPVAGSSTLNLSFFIPGVGNVTDIDENNNPSPRIIEARVKQVGTDPQLVFDHSTLKDFTYNSAKGTFDATIPNLPPGVYTVKIKANNSLFKDYGFVTLEANKPTEVVPQILVTGDLNGDNVLNLQDYNIFVSCYEPKVCNQKELADINFDGKVSAVDLNIFYSALAKQEGD